MSRILETKRSNYLGKFLWVVVLVIIAGRTLCFSQKKPLYFIIASTQKSDNKYDEQFLTFFAKTGTDMHLKITDTLSDMNHYMHFVKILQDERFAVLLKEDVKTKEKTIVKIDLNQARINQKNLGYANWHLSLEENIVKKTESGFYKLVVNLIPRNDNLEDTTELKLGINLANLTTEKANADDYATAILTGMPGGSVTHPDVLRYKNDGSDNLLRIPITYDFTKRPVFEIVFPDSVRLTPKSTNLIFCNTRSVFLAEINTEAEDGYSGKKLTQRKIVVLNKKNGRWFRMSVPGNIAKFTSFEKWIAGIVTQKYAKNGYKDPWLSPGKEQRKRQQWITSYPIDQKMQMLGSYYPGILFLINSETQDYIEWDTKQGDSEILLVKNEVVYYRVFDKIFKRPILKGKTLGKEELVVHDRFVPDIHWAFMPE